MSSPALGTLTVVLVQKLFRKAKSDTVSVCFNLMIRVACALSLAVQAPLVIEDVSKGREE
jgi:hypothetical protein